MYAFADGVKFIRGVGLSLTHIMADGTSRVEKLKSEVFKPSWNQPTMSLEEFADLELQDALAREKRSKEAEANPDKPRSYKQLYEAGLEDDEDLVEKARKKDSKLSLVACISPTLGTAIFLTLLFDMYAL